MSEVSWQALALALTVSGAVWTWYAARNRGAASGVRGAAITLLPGAAYLTGTLEVAGEVASSLADWATGFVFSPLVWLGIVLAGVSVLLFGAAGWMSARSEPDETESGKAVDEGRKGKRKRGSRELPEASGRGKPVIDDDLAEIEAILKKRGIS